MKYRVTLNNRTYEIEVERGNAILKAEYDAKKRNFATALEKPTVSVPETNAEPVTPEEKTLSEKEE